MVKKMVSLRERTERPMRAVDSNRIAYKFHERVGAPQIWENHIREVKTKSTETTVVEPAIIDDPRSDVYRAWVNSVLNDILNYHDVKHDVVRGIRHNPKVRTPALRDERVIEEIEFFGELTELDRKGADLSEYVPLLNNGHAPLALLARILDYAVTHNDGKYLNDFISPTGHPILRMFCSYEEALETLRNEAKAGEMIYAPIAELFGHPSLAGDILTHSFKVRYPQVYEHVTESLKDGIIREKLYFTRTIVRGIKKKIVEELHNMGFDVEMQERMAKHMGKTMRKVRKMLAKKYEDSEESRFLSLKQYITNHVEKFDITELNDLVAMRVILDKYRGEEIDSMEEEKKEHIISMAVGTIKERLNEFVMDSENSYRYSHDFWEKENGYRSHHFDVKPVTMVSAARFEIQVRTTEWHEISEHGKAAHYYYIGGNSEFVDMIKDSYKDRIHLFRK